MQGNLEAERAYLGTVIGFPEKNLRFIPEDYFYNSGHKKIYKAILELKNKNVPLSLVAIIDRLRETGELENCGGASYVAHLIDGYSIHPDLAESYAKILARKYSVRKICEKAVAIEKAASSEDFDEISSLIRDFENIPMDFEDEKPEKNFWQTQDEFLRELETPSKRILTGIKTWDVFLGGLHPGRLIVVAGGDGSGKTTLAINILLNVSEKGLGPVLFYSLEMNSFSIYSRVYSMRTGISSTKFETRDLNDEDWHKISFAANELSRLDWKVQAETNISEVISLAREIRPKFIALDYLQLLAKGFPDENLATNLAYCSRQLKILAGEIDCPILACSSLTKEAKRKEWEFSLGDIKESGGITEAADLVIFLKKTEDRVEFNILKNRYGPLGRFFLRLDSDSLRFLEEEQEFEFPAGNGK